MQEHLQLLAGSSAQATEAALEAGQAAFAAAALAAKRNEALAPCANLLIFSLVGQAELPDVS